MAKKGKKAEGKVRGLDSEDAIRKQQEQIKERVNVFIPPLL
jgi:hypothetical protein